MSQKVFRVQADDGRGPWRPGWSHIWINGDVPSDARIMETLMDLMPVERLQALPRDMSYGCACRSLDALMEWFTPRERETLKTFGFYPVELAADVVLAESPFQMLVGRRRPFADGATRRNWR